VSDTAKDRVRTYVSRELLLRDDTSSLADDEELLSQIDSMAIMELVSFIEDTFQVVLEYDELDADNFRTLDSIDALIQRKVGTT
jgi:acyl carrier protein